MAAILQTKGPIVTPTVAKFNWKFLHMMSTRQFLKAAADLESLRLGRLVNLSQVAQKPSMVFLKIPPDDIMMELQMDSNADLCSIEIYTKQFHKPVSKSVSLNLRSRLVSTGLVPEKLLK